MSLNSISHLMFIYFHLLSSGFIEYTCHGSWVENQTTTFIIARHSKYIVCISFKQLTPDTAQLFIGDSCYREQQAAFLDAPAERFYTIANLTNVGRKFIYSDIFGQLIQFSLHKQINAARLALLSTFQHLIGIE